MGRNQKITSDAQRVLKTALRHEHPPRRTADSSSSDGHTDSESDNEAPSGNPAWADSIAKVLKTNTPKDDMSIVLSKAKKEAPKPTEPSEPVSFEIDGELPKDLTPHELLKQERKRLRNKQLSLRAKPSAADIERERALRRVSTRGVVQLFNAVRAQQKDIQKRLKIAGPLDSKRDAVLNNIDKKQFLDVLMTGDRAKSEAVKTKKLSPRAFPQTAHLTYDDDYLDEAERVCQKGWDVLSEDFPTNKKKRYWDVEETENNKASLTNKRSKNDKAE